MATVTISQGKLKGAQAKTDSGFEYYEFLGIPYAKPPVGELRFKDPQPPVPWNDVRDATSIDPSMIACQVDFLTRKIKGSEDCLYLNVYTPQLPTVGSKLRPVMVNIHGGGFVVLQGIVKEEHGPDFLIENDVVMVSINYRLGVMGFLSLDIPEAAGNMGMKDQVKALEWVRNNIDKFGGDKDNVTIFGISAGAASVEYLMLSPLSRGLFHKAIAQSGSTLSDWAINHEPITLATKLAESLRYQGSDEDFQSIYQFLMKIDSLTLTLASFALINSYTSNKTFFGFVPSIEKDFGDGKGFLTKSPYKMLKEGSFMHVPTIRGSCSNEGSMVDLMKPDAIKNMIVQKSFTDCWPYKLGEKDVTLYNSKLSALYIDNISEDKLEDSVMQFYGDLNFVGPVWIVGKIQSDNEVPVYMYKFCYDGNLNNFKKLFGYNKKGAAHGDCTGYVFGHKQLIADDAAISVRKGIVKMWTEFAKTGNPTPEDSSEVPVQWPKFEQGSMAYLNIDNEFTIKADGEPKSLKIFEEIFAKYEK